MTIRDVANDFETWAQVAARLRGRSASEREQLLHELGLTQAWGGVHEAWSHALNEDITERRMDRPNRYVEICAAEQHARSSEKVAPKNFSHALMPPTTPSQPARNQMVTMQVSNASPAPHSPGPSAPPRPSATPGAGSDFRAAFGPRVPVVAPLGDQERTVTRLDVTALRASAEAAKAAVTNFSVEDWGNHCASLRRATSEADRERAWAAIGIVGPGDQHWVHSTWVEKLTADPALYERYCAVLQRG
ncbi:MAG: hypothetical protein EXR75_10320 [Myxococcales bacterium]|nr:hypothetical protein [Myxococcales bacterium]